MIMKVAILLSLHVKARHIFSLTLFSYPHPQRAMQFIWFHKKETLTQIKEATYNNMSLQMIDSTEHGVIENVEWLRNTGSNSVSYT